MMYGLRALPLPARSRGRRKWIYLDTTCSLFIPHNTRLDLWSVVAVSSKGIHAKLPKGFQ